MILTLEVNGQILAGRLDLQKARIKRPGSRGGKYYIDKQGNIIYGTRNLGHQSSLFDEPESKPEPKKKAEPKKQVTLSGSSGKRLKDVLDDKKGKKLFGSDYGYLKGMNIKDIENDHSSGVENFNKIISAIKKANYSGDLDSVEFSHWKDYLVKKDKRGEKGNFEEWKEERIGDLEVKIENNKKVLQSIEKIKKQYNIFGSSEPVKKETATQQQKRVEAVEQKKQIDKEKQYQQEKAKQGKKVVTTRELAKKKATHQAAVKKEAAGQSGMFGDTAGQQGGLFGGKEESKESEIKPLNELTTNIPLTFKGYANEKYGVPSMKDHRVKVDKFVLSYEDAEGNEYRKTLEFPVKYKMNFEKVRSFVPKTLKPNESKTPIADTAKKVSEAAGNFKSPEVEQMLVKFKDKYKDVYEYDPELADRRMDNVIGMMLSGNGHADMRIKMMEHLTGKKTPKSKAGITVLTEKILEHIKQ